MKFQNLFKKKSDTKESESLGKPRKIEEQQSRSMEPRCSPGAELYIQSLLRSGYTREQAEELVKYFY